MNRIELGKVFRAYIKRIFKDKLLDYIGAFVKDTHFPIQEKTKKNNSIK